MTTHLESEPQRHRVRKVTRVIRDVDAWSVFKVALVFHTAMYIVVMMTGFLLWNVGSSTGTIDNIEQFLASFGWDSFAFEGSQIFWAAAFFGLFGIALGAGVWVLAAVGFNLITELVGGVKVTVLEEEVVARTVEPDHTQR